MRRQSDNTLLLKSSVSSSSFCFKKKIYTILLGANLIVKGIAISTHIIILCTAHKSLAHRVSWPPIIVASEESRRPGLKAEKESEP